MWRALRLAPILLGLGLMATPVQGDARLLDFADLQHWEADDHQAALTSFPNQAVVIRGDGRCEYQRVMDAFSACKQAGVRNISVAHLPRQK